MAQTPQQLADKWAAAVEFSVDTAIASVNAMDTSPAVTALANKQKMIDNFNAVMGTTKWEDGLAPFTSLPAWQARMIPGLERNRTITVGQKAKLTDHFAVQQQVNALFEVVLGLVDAGTNGVITPAGINAVLLRVIVNATLNKHINEFTTSSTSSSMLSTIIPSLVADYGFTTP